jgi:hypothetical protein
MPWHDVVVVPHLPRKLAQRRYPNLVKTRRSRSPHSLGPLPLVCRDSLEKRRGQGSRKLFRSSAPKDHRYTQALLKKGVGLRAVASP